MPLKTSVATDTGASTTKSAMPAVAIRSGRIDRAMSIAKRASRKLVQAWCPA
ncbi:hypothetical protein [Noviherbaspirillum humi]|uniref:hypothetical protein n=1 Tax=Noviherbaspirillum humi TaxID=1688639 RepID=UPI00159503B8|nr:hypothetical protein [Noviherbaspirillum humi]